MALASRRQGRWGLALAVLALGGLAAGGVLVWWGLREEPPASVVIELERPAVGVSTRVTASFAEPRGGLGNIRLELQQGERVEQVAAASFARPGLGGGPRTAEHVLDAALGSRHQAWLAEGELTIRAVADRAAGFLRSPAPVTVERRVPVRLRPPRLQVVSSGHYLRQGGAGVVVIEIDEAAARSGVRAGDREFRSYPLPGGSSRQRLVLFGVPWQGVAAAEVRAFAEDAAGNRAEQAFVNGLKPVARRKETIELGPAFLERVVTAIAAETPGFDASGSLLEQYLRINRDMRRADLQRVAELTGASEERPLWQGSFLQLPDSKRMAGFAETRTYRFEGREVDTQTHLGLDLASTARAEVPAANAGRVVAAGWFGIYGRAVLLDHGCGLASLYGHLSEVAVTAGQSVARGQTIGRTGMTGLAGGDHLHFEVFVQGLSVDPIEWLDAHWMQDNVLARLPASR
ncbi:MAG TPA: peptidoglycan DD-metalloendopeptidase family protein [Thermoanaerobaculaceae bacterium]|nr:peptidoglycan DD-metalloendopeptidase family protein [Thermoanaerobaculaceae bacterium]HRS14862.1 peptidoglycan DD-metalloendopeptidase family protein [Thermoanaerobaculaceae bacterium]